MVNLEKVRDSIVMVQVLGGQPIIGVLDDNGKVYDNMDVIKLKYAVMFQTHIDEDKKMSFIPIKLSSLCKEDAEYFINKDHIIFITGDLDDEIIDYYINMFKMLTDDAEKGVNEVVNDAVNEEKDKIIQLNSDK